MMACLLIVGLWLPRQACAIVTELGVSYGEKKTTFDANNDFQTESITASVSFYFAEKLALELSYTDATSLQHLQATPLDTLRTVYQKSQIIGADLIWIIADKTAMFQPFVKAGLAQVNRSQTIKDGSFPTDPAITDNAIVPNYGVGIKVAITDTFGLKATYSVWQTPIGGGATTNDDAITAGVTWIF